MRVLLQRVTEARVTVGDRVTGEIGPGLLALVCAMPGDTDADVRKMAERVAKLRIFRDEAGRLSLEAALVTLACDAIGAPLSTVKSPRLTVDAIPGFAEAAAEVGKLKNWRIHEPAFDQANLSKYFHWQAWTLKPAFCAEEYGEGIEIGTHLNPAFPFAMRNPDAAG